MEVTCLPGTGPLHCLPGGPAACGPPWRLLGWALHCHTVIGRSLQPRATKAGSGWTGHPGPRLLVGGGRLLARPAALWALARHGTVSGDRRFRAPAICRLGGMKVSLQAREEMAARAGPEQDPGRRAEGGSGRKAPGWAGQRAGGPPPRSGRHGRPPGQVCVCAHVYLRAGARAPFPIRNVAGVGGPVRRREHPVHLWTKGLDKNNSHDKVSVLLN